jgi:predicted Rossmann-fold nucleotide-binding protein
LNINGFYTHLLEWINTAVKFGFIRPANAKIVVEARDVNEVLEKLEGYTLPDGVYGFDWTVEGPSEKGRELPNGGVDTTQDQERSH